MVLLQCRFFMAGWMNTFAYMWNYTYVDLLCIRQDSNRNSSSGGVLLIDTSCNT